MKIRNRKIKNKSSGSYLRLIGNNEYAQLMTKIQSAVISQGKELEKEINALICEKYPEQVIKKLSDFMNLISHDHIKKEFYFLDVKIYRQFLKNSKIKEIKSPDFVIIFIYKNFVYVVELKEGYDFDTKKSAGEKEHLEKIQKDLQTVLPKFNVKYYFCSFYAENIDQMYNGLKKEFNKNNLWTGKDFFKFISLDYNKFINYRQNILKTDAQDNIEYIWETINKHYKK